MGLDLLGSGSLDLAQDGYRTGGGSGGCPSPKHGSGGSGRSVTACHRQGGHVQVDRLVCGHGSSGSQSSHDRIRKCRLLRVHGTLVRLDALTGGTLGDLDEALQALTAKRTGGNAVGGREVNVLTGLRTARHATVEGRVRWTF